MLTFFYSFIIASLILWKRHFKVSKSLRRVESQNGFLEKKLRELNVKFVSVEKSLESSRYDRVHFVVGQSSSGESTSNT